MMVPCKEHQFHSITPPCPGGIRGLCMPRRIQSPKTDKLMVARVVLAWAVPPTLRVTGVFQRLQQPFTSFSLVLWPLVRPVLYPVLPLSKEGGDTAVFQEAH